MRGTRWVSGGRVLALVQWSGAMVASTERRGLTMEGTWRVMATSHRMRPEDGVVEPGTGPGERQ